jgi:hypothetical protein
MTLTAAICFAAAFFAEVTGIYLIVQESKNASRALRRWRAANPEGHPEGALGQTPLLNALMEHLLGSQAKRTTAVILLFLGIAAGAAGNYFSLDWGSDVRP